MKRTSVRMVPSVRHFENLTLWIPLRLGLRDRAWKATNGHSRKLAQLSMTIFSKFWSRGRYPVCIHGSRPRCFYLHRGTSHIGSCWHVFSGRASPYLNAGCQYALDLDGAVVKPNGIAQTASILIRTRGGRPLACHFANPSVEMARFVHSVSKTMFY